MKSVADHADGRRRHRRAWHRATLVLALSLAACQDSAGPPKKAAVPTPVDPATAGTIQVDVKYAGAAPAPQVLNMQSAPQCAAAHVDPVYDQSLLVHDGQLANAVVWIKQGLQHWVFAPPSQPVVIDQKGCVYQPHVAAAMVGQDVRFVNSDSEPHNVHGHPQQVASWNFLMSRQGAWRTVSFDKPEIGIPVGCDIHPWMRAYLAVLDNPYFAVTPANGSVSLAQVPPGDYVVAAWQEKLGTKEQRVTLPPKGAVRVQLTFE